MLAYSTINIPHIYCSFSSIYVVVKMNINNKCKIIIGSKTRVIIKSSRYAQAFNNISIIHASIYPLWIFSIYLFFLWISTISQLMSNFVIIIVFFLYFEIMYVCNIILFLLLFY